MIAAPVLRTVCAGITMFGLLVACDRQPADAATAAQPYEITTQTRPESINGYLKIYRAAHQVCAFTREAMQLPAPPPLVQLPSSFVTERTTYLSSGRAYLTRKEEFFIDLAELTPELGCKSRLGSRMTEELVQGGQVHSARRDVDGVLEVYPVTPLLPPKQDAANGYSERKNLGGVAMRCAPSNATLGPKVMQDLCVLDVASGVPLDGQGQVIVVHLRNTLMEAGDIVFLTEPVSVQIGKPVSEQRLSLSIK
jgi:hypothetical protein